MITIIVSKTLFSPSVSRITKMNSELQKQIGAYSEVSIFTTHRCSVTKGFYLLVQPQPVHILVRGCSLYIIM